MTREGKTCVLVGPVLILLCADIVDISEGLVRINNDEVCSADSSVW